MGLTSMCCVPPPLFSLAGCAGSGEVRGALSPKAAPFSAYDLERLFAWIESLGSVVRGACRCFRVHRERLIEGLLQYCWIVGLIMLVSLAFAGVGCSTPRS
jgi:hypothetical protein